MSNRQEIYLFNADYEKRLLGCLMYYTDEFYEVSRLLEPDDLYRDIHRTIYSLICRFKNKGEHPDPLVVAEALEHKGITSIEDQDAELYLMRLTEMDPTSANVRMYARRIMHLAELRRLREAGGKIVALTASEDVLSGEEDAVEAAESMIMKVKRRGADDDFVTVGEYLSQYIDHIRELTDEGKHRGISTGISNLDFALGGLQPGMLYIPAARTGMGKTTLVQNFAYHAARSGRQLAFFSCEMSRDDLMDRFVSIHTGIDSQQLSNGAISEENLVEAINEHYDEFEAMGIHFKHTPGISIYELKSQARALVIKKNISMIIVDYLQLVKATVNGKRIQPREQEIAEVVRELKILAGELGVPVVAPAQLNREIEHRASSEDNDGDEPLTYKMPQLSDLRESGELEQSADVVMFLARSEQKQERVKLVVAKNRKGRQCEIDLLFKGDKMRFYSVTKRQ